MKQYLFVLLLILALTSCKDISTGPSSSLVDSVAYKFTNFIAGDQFAEVITTDGPVATTYNSGVRHWRI